MNGISEIKKTPRGFAYIAFKNSNGEPCRLQKSSLATDDMIWLGFDEIGLKLFADGKWQDVMLTKNHVANTRMHLSRSQVAELLPFLKRFVETGEIEE